jgi:AcrR family transcriptional regulator
MSEPHAAQLDPKSRAILAAAAQVFSEKGYHSATMRDIAALAGTSLAGMYYYFASKEAMLYSIQNYCFSAVLAGLRERLTHEQDPWRRLYVFIENHLRFFIENVREMRVLSHESESLSGEHLATIQAMKREYFHELGEILRALLPAPVDERRLREQVLSVFGMVNWIYTWYDPARDGDARELSECMYALLERGIAPQR